MFISQETDTLFVPRFEFLEFFCDTVVCCYVSIEKVPGQVPVSASPLLHLKQLNGRI